jgi:Flp pilus assembly protein TadD
MPMKPSMIERGESQPLPRMSQTRPSAPLPPTSPRPAAPNPGKSGSFEVSDAKQPGVLNSAQAAASFYQQGKARYDQGDIHGAEHMLRQAVRLEPMEWHYHFYLGLTLTVLSQARHNHSHQEGCHVSCKIGAGLVRNQRVRHEAEQHLVKAAELDPFNAKIRLNLALLYKEAGMTKKAEQYFYETLLLDAQNKTALRELGLSNAPSSREIKSAVKNR